MNKVKDIDEVAKLVKNARSDGKKVGLITGCFDVLHLGHIKLFRFAKREVDILVVGLENDKSIGLTKGKARPVHSLEQRLEVLSDLRSVDWIFPIEELIKFNEPEKASAVYRRIYREVMPNFVITNKEADRFWEEKRQDAETVGIKLLLDKQREFSSSTASLQKLERKVER